MKKNKYQISINLVIFFFFLQIRGERLQRGPGDESFGQISLVVPTRSGQVAGYRRFQGYATHRTGCRTGQIGKNGLVGGIQFFGRGHPVDFLPDKSVLATARVARRREFVFVRSEDNRRHLPVFGVLFEQDGF